MPRRSESGAIVRPTPPSSRVTSVGVMKSSQRWASGGRMRVTERQRDSRPRRTLLRPEVGGKPGRPAPVDRVEGEEGSWSHDAGEFASGLRQIEQVLEHVAGQHRIEAAVFKRQVKHRAAPDQLGGRAATHPTTYSMSRPDARPCARASEIVRALRSMPVTS